MELIIGSHVGFNKNEQLYGSVLEALSYGENTFMFYTGAPQNTARAEIDEYRTKEAADLMVRSGINIDNVIIHAPYIINLANKTNEDFSVSFLKQEISRAEKLGISKIVLHPGSHVGAGIEVGLNNIIDSLNMALNKDTKVKICIETMAGKGTELGINFDQIKTIIDGVKENDKLLVCLDTCHLNDAGYDVSKFDEILDEFDHKIGINKIGCIHVNDSKNIIGSHKDRHENIGLGTIGFDNLINVIYNPRIKDVPKILETPYIGDDNESKDRLYPPFKYEIEMIENKKFNENILDDIRKYYR